MDLTNLGVAEFGRSEGNVSPKRGRPLSAVVAARVLPLSQLAVELWRVMEMIERQCQ